MDENNEFYESIKSHQTEILSALEKMKLTADLEAIEDIQKRQLELIHDVEELIKNKIWDLGIKSQTKAGEAKLGKRRLRLLKKNEAINQKN